MAIDDYNDNDVADFTQALHGDAWVRSDPAEAVKVLLEIGALEQCGWQEVDAARWTHYELNDDPDEHAADVANPWLEPVYRLVTEENRDGD